VRLALTVTNGVARTLHNPKLVVTSVTGGTAAAPTGQYGGSPYYFMGPNSLGSTGSVDRAFNINGVNGTVDPVLVTVEIADDPALFVNTHNIVGISASVVDTGANRQTTAIGCDSYVYPLNAANRCSWRDAVTSWDGRYLYVGNRGNPAVRVLDTTVMEVVGAIQLETFGNIESLSWGGQYLYAAINTTGHAFQLFGDRQSDGGIILVKLRARGAELEEVARLDLVTGALATDGVRARFMATTPDGTTGAVPLWNKGEVALVDLEDMTLIDTDSATAGTQGIDVSAVGITPREVVFSADGATLYVGYSLLDATNVITTVQMSDFAQGTLATTGVVGNGVNNMRVDAMGRLWVARGRANLTNAGAVSVYDAGNVTHLHVVDTPLAANTRYADALALSSDGTRAYVSFFGDRNAITPRVAVFNVATLAQIDVDGAAGNGTTNIVLSQQPGGHTAVITEY
jgi:hypothetical protein